MAARIDPALEDPNNTDPWLWRYMSLGRLLWIIQNRKLWFTRLDRFDDKFKGAVTEIIFEKMAELANTSFSDYRAYDFSLNKLRNAKREYFASCWHMNDTEAYSMWRSYANVPEAIAIRTRLSTLGSCFTHEQVCDIAKVIY